MSVNIIEVAAKSENCINCARTYNINSANGLECSYPCLLFRIIFGRRVVKPNHWCERFKKINNEKTR
jgi:hypothetical protein